MISLIVYVTIMVIYALSILLVIMQIGKERAPVTPGEVILRLLFVAGIIWAITANWDWS